MMMILRLKGMQALTVSAAGPTCSDNMSDSGTVTKSSPPSMGAVAVTPMPFSSASSSSLPTGPMCSLSAATPATVARAANLRCLSSNNPSRLGGGTKAGLTLSCILKTMSRMATSSPMEQMAASLFWVSFSSGASVCGNRGGSWARAVEPLGALLSILPRPRLDLPMAFFTRARERGASGPGDFGPAARKFACGASQNPAAPRTSGARAAG
mmetsp:Transcript_17740/g.54272  ORF Transcript_17740/g.54272 Transcript_17740/m.54272 type:complete len:211 (+) Transcript_17740:241-873(+)